MNPSPAAVRELRARLGPRVASDPATRALYASDASNYRIPPAAVVRSASIEEVIEAVACCHELGLPVVARGAGTSVAGNAVGPGVVLDLTALDRVTGVDPDGRTATVQAGVIQAGLQKAVLPHGLLFGPDPSTADRCTIGGMIGNNACGAHAVAWGNTRDNLRAAHVVLADGTPVLITRTGTSDPALDERIRAAVAADLAVVRTEYGRFARQASGYALESLLPERGFDVARSFAGSEGTLAVLLEATVDLVPRPAARALAVLGYPDMASAADATPSLVGLGPLAVEGMDGRLVEVVRRRRGSAGMPDLPTGDGWLLVETGGADAGEAESAARAVAAASGARDFRVLSDAAQMAGLWRIRTDGVGLAGRTPAGADAWPGWEDAAVPPERLGAYLRDLAVLLDRHGFDGLLYGHFGDGCVHGRFDFDLRSGAARTRAFLEDAADLAVAHGGSLSGEHGDGRARGELLARMYSPAALAAAARVKRAWDPGHRLNPGILVDPARLDADLRIVPSLPVLDRTGFAYPNDSGDLTRAVHRCVGIARCRADLTRSGGAMCPSYQATGEDLHSTRGRARLLQEMTRHDGLLPGRWRDPALHEALDLCLACKACSRDCPAGVDMATYKAEVLYQSYKGRPRPVSHYSLGWLPHAARVAGRVPRLANALLGGRATGALVKRLAGVDARRDLPSFARPQFRRWLSGHRPPSAGEPVLLWVDTFTQFFSPEIGIAAVRVLEAAGYRVEVTDAQVCCGLTWISTGQLDVARRRLRRTYDALESALNRAAPDAPEGRFGRSSLRSGRPSWRTHPEDDPQFGRSSLRSGRPDRGVPIVGLEPSCTAVLRSDAPDLLPDDPRAEAVARATVTLAELLTRTPGWTPPDLSGVEAVAQPHCHHRSVLGWETDAELLRRAGARVTSIGGCCGLAGNFGVERGHYEVSVAVAETALLPALREADGAPVLADGFSCRTQIGDLAGAPALHLAELLAERIDGD